MVKQTSIILVYVNIMVVGGMSEMVKQISLQGHYVNTMVYGGM